jgi:hypothetical protein
MGPPSSTRISRVPVYLSLPTILSFRIQGYHPLWLTFPDHSAKTRIDVDNKADPRSLAATNGISVDFFSSGYLDVSVPRVRFNTPMYSVYDF